VNTEKLATAYEKLIAAAREVDERTTLPPDERTNVDWTLSHVSLSDELLSAGARNVIAGQLVHVNNRSAMSRDNIAALLARTTHADRIDLVRRNGAQFTSLVARVPEELAATPMRLTIYNSEEQLAAELDITWAELVRMRSEEHIPGHAARLASFAAKVRLNG
jgi:hypothetical protein